jgi:hypothetical protein
MPLPTLHHVEDVAKYAEESLRRFVAVLRGRNWVRMLIILNVLLFLAFRPTVLSETLELVTNTKYEVPKQYPLYFWSLFTIITVSALCVAWRTTPPKAIAFEANLSRRTLIKGLRPFEIEDADAFSQLERTPALQQCFEQLCIGIFALAFYLESQEVVRRRLS